MEGDELPSLHKGKPTLLFIQLQMLEKHSINPLEFFIGKEATWQNEYGEALKILLTAYHQILAEEERRIHEENKKKTKSNKKYNF